MIHKLQSFVFNWTCGTGVNDGEQTHQCQISWDFFIHTSIRSRWDRSRGRLKAISRELMRSFPLEVGHRTATMKPMKTREVIKGVSKKLLWSWRDEGKRTALRNLINSEELHNGVRKEKLRSGRDTLNVHTHTEENHAHKTNVYTTGNALSYRNILLGR